MSQKFYKEPTIIRAKSGWRVRFYYEIPGKPGKYKMFDVKDGINYVKDLKERERQAEILRDDIEKELIRGWSPFETRERAIRTLESKLETLNAIEEAKKIKPWTLREAFEKFDAHIKWKGLSENSIRSYTTFIRTIKSWMEDEGILDTLACEFTEDVMYEFINEYNGERGWSTRTYNNYALFFVTFFNAVRKLEKKQNRATKYEFDTEGIELKADRAEKNRYYTDLVLSKVKKELEKQPEFGAKLRERRQLRIELLYFLI